MFQSGTADNPLFQANQIGKLLDIKNIRDAIKDYDKDERVVVQNYSLGGEQQTTFLTLYKTGNSVKNCSQWEVLFSSKLNSTLTI